MHVCIGSGEGRVSTKGKSIKEGEGSIDLVVRVYSIKEGEGNINIVSVVGSIVCSI